MGSYSCSKPIPEFQAVTLSVFIHSASLALFGFATKDVRLPTKLELFVLNLAHGCLKTASIPARSVDWLIMTP